jgi:pimeloyl-ACP methyl ester carboxylesterase
MNPFFFGTADHRLFGVYQPSRREAGRRGVVLCYPWGHEYVPAHKAFKALASLLADAGHEVLRFDYHGTGDSGGDLDGTTPPSWRADVSTAIDELKDTAGPQQICLCGLRMGAAWAAQVAAERSDVTRIVAWDPVWDGRAYLQALEKDARSEGDTLEDRGLALTPEARAQFEAITPALYTRLRLPVLVIVTQGNAAGIEPALRPGPGGDGGVDVEYVEGACPWTEGEFGPGGLPVQALRRIADWLG